MLWLSCPSAVGFVAQTLSNMRLYRASIIILGVTKPVAERHSEQNAENIYGEKSLDIAVNKDASEFVHRPIQIQNQQQR